MPDYPFGRVVGKFVQVVQGIPGDGSEPVYTPVRGLRITFRARLDDERLRVLRSTDPTSILLQEFVCRTDDEGYLINGVGERWQELPATVDPELGFSEWLWEVTIQSPVGSPRPFRFVLPVYTIEGTERDLTTVAHVSSAPGRELADWETVYLRVQGTVGLVEAAGNAIIADITAEGEGMEARAVASATAAAASSSAQAQAAAAASANSASIAEAHATDAAGSVTEAATAADRAETAADSIDTDVLEAQIALKADRTYVDQLNMDQKTYVDERTVIAYTRRTKGTAQVINPATWTQVTWPTDAGTAGITYASEVFTIPSTGRYAFVMQVAFAVSNTTGQRVCRIRRGADEIVAQSAQMTPPGTTYPIVSAVSTVLNCAVGDEFVVDVYHSAGSGVNVNLGGAAESSFISIDRIS